MLLYRKRRSVRTSVGQVEEGERIPIKGGSILKVSNWKVREVKAFSDPGPIGRPGNTVGGMGVLEDEAWQLLGKDGWGKVV